MDDRGWRTPAKRRVPFRVPAGVGVVVFGASAASVSPLGLTAAGVVALLGLLLVVSGVREIRRARRVEAHGTPATGVVIAAKRLGGEQSSVNWRTTIALDEPVGGVSETAAVGAMPPYTGDTVRVHLDPEDPGYAVVVGFRPAPLPETSDPQVLAMRAGRRGVYTRRG